MCGCVYGRGGGGVVVVIVVTFVCACHSCVCVCVCVCVCACACVRACLFLYSFHSQYDTPLSHQPSLSGDPTATGI